MLPSYVGKNSLSFFISFENNVKTCTMSVLIIILIIINNIKYDIDNIKSSTWLYLSAAGPNIIFAECRAERVWYYRVHTQTVVLGFSPSYTLFVMFISCVVILVKLGGEEHLIRRRKNKEEGTYEV